MSAIMRTFVSSRRKAWLAVGLAVPVVASAIIVPLTARTQGAGFQRVRSGGISLPLKCEVTIETRDGYRYITSNGIPDHTVGQFPGPGNPNTISAQKYNFRIPLNPQAVAGEHRGQLFGVAVNGVVFDPGTAELWNGNFAWHYEALTGLYGSRGALGADENFAHVQPNGAYHYHGLPMGLLKRLDYKNKMGLVGYAADGFPVYGPYGYANPGDSKSGMKALKSSYHLKSGSRPDGPGGAYDGSFASDYEYMKGSGDLDEFNGRTGVTPEYPKGTFYYVISEAWPFVPRKLRGVPDPSFQKGPGGPGGPGGFAGGPRGQGGPGGGFGGPGGQGAGQGRRQGGPAGAGREVGGPAQDGPGGPGGAGIGQGGPGGPGGFGGPGGQGGPGFGGPAANMVPLDVLGDYLALTRDQKDKLELLKKTVAALQKENFAMPNLGLLKLKEEQVKKIAGGAKVADVLTAGQKAVLDAHKRPQGGRGFGGPGGPGGGFGGPGGGPGGPGGPGAPGE